MNSQVVQEEEKILKILQEKHKLKPTQIIKKRCHGDCAKTTEKPESEGIIHHINGLTIWFCGEKHLNLWLKEYKLKK